MKLLERLLKDSKLGVHILVVIFAISSWVDMNGMWVELPIFVTHLPEQWQLPSYMTILAQAANIGPLIFILIAFCLKRASASLTAKSTLDKVTCYVIMIVGVAACLLLAFLWQRTLTIAGEERSFALLALSFFLSVVDCTSSLAFVAFMAALKPQYMSSFFIGEGLSGLVPALLALGQGAGDIICVNVTSTSLKNESGQLENVTSWAVWPQYLPPRFSVQVFFLLLTGMITASIVAFTLLNYLEYCKDEFADTSSYTLKQDTEETAVVKQSSNSYRTFEHSGEPLGGAKHIGGSPKKSEHFGNSPGGIEHFRGSPGKTEHFGDSLGANEHIRDPLGETEHVRSSPMDTESSGDSHGEIGPFGDSSGKNLLPTKNDNARISKTGISNPGLNVSQEQLPSSFDNVSGVVSSESSPHLYSDFGGDFCSRNDTEERFGHPQSDQAQNDHFGGSSGNSRNGQNTTTIQNRGGINEGEGNGEDVSLTQEGEGEVSTALMLLLLALVVIINYLIVGFLLAIQVYSSLPYGISTYNLVTTLSNVANPLACFCALFLTFTSPCVIGGLTAVGVACGAYIITAAAMSPTPPLVDGSAGAPVMILIWVGAAFFLTYAKISVAGVMRRLGRRALIWYGVATQLGGLLGAVTGFVLVNEVQLFHDASWC